MSSKEISDRKILLIRHGRTSWNSEHRFQGRSDIALSEEGLAQAARTAVRLTNWPMDALYTSPLIRARQTAEAIARPHGTQISPLDDLTETDFGVWEGQRLAELREAQPEKLRAWLKDPFFNVPDGAETWDAIRVRVGRALDAILREENGRVALIAHGGTLRAIFALLLKFDPHTVWNIQASNCALSGIEIRQGEITLAFANDDLHLKTSQDTALPVW